MPAGKAARKLPRAVTSSEQAALEELARRGYRRQFGVAGDGLRADGEERAYRPDELKILGYYRFEGASDPDDMSIVYAIETSSGVRGTLVTAYGVYADPAVTAVLEGVPVVTEGPPET
jgi:hypothetical protein